VVPFFRLQTLALLIAGLSLVSAPAAQARTLLDVGSSDLETATVVPTPNHLPTWVQVAVANAPLYGSDSVDQPRARLPRNTFLRVLGSGASLLQVQAYDENGNPGQDGWVDPNQVLPSAPGTDWLVASTATTLWSASDASATRMRTLDRFTPLMRVDGPVLDRILVRVFSSDFSGMLDQGWIDATSTGPALPPQMRVPAPTDRPSGLRTASGTGLQQAFLDATAQPARDAAALTGVPASVTVAQAILESDWGRSSLATSANNYFGMKAMGTLGTDGVVYLPTSEYDADGQLYQTVSAFRAYKSLADSLADHDRLLGTASRYAGAMRSAKDPKQFAALITQAGYSTDPAYADKLVSLMDRYNLYQLDAA
jgi:hypothetical protein